MEKQEKEQRVREMYPTMTASEIARATGIPRTTVTRYAKKTGVRHTPETMERIKRKHADALDRVRAQTDRRMVAAKIAAKMSRIWKTERVKVMSGQPQKTRLRIKTLPKRVSQAMRYLANKYNYIYENGRTTMYYDSMTRRCGKREAYYASRYCIHFEAGEE